MIKTITQKDLNDYIYGEYGIEDFDVYNYRNMLADTDGRGK